jgi:hypothetical protein
MNVLYDIIYHVREYVATGMVLITVSSHLQQQYSNHPPCHDDSGVRCGAILASEQSTPRIAWHSIAHHS